MFSGRGGLSGGSTFYYVFFLALDQVSSKGKVFLVGFLGGPLNFSI